VALARLSIVSTTFEKRAEWKKALGSYI